jgi:7-cyano-7-deazaguanine synthase
MEEENGIASCRDGRDGAGGRGRGDSVEMRNKWKMPKAYVLLSGGMDSTTCLYLAHREFNGNVVAVSVNYGQRHKKEIDYAHASCVLLNIDHEMLDLSSVVPKTMLTDKSSVVPDISYSDIKGVSPTYVPFRNGLLLSAITSFVHGKYRAPGEWGIYFGAHAEDAQNWAYPDCTPEFIGAMANAIYIGTYRAIRLHTPLQWLSKDQIVMLGNTLGIDWENTWSCYKGGSHHCGVCPTCRARKDAFKKAGCDDPTVYEKTPERKVPNYQNQT